MVDASSLNVYGGRLYFAVDTGDQAARGIYSMTEDFTDLRHIYVKNGVYAINIVCDTIYFRTGGDTEGTADDILYTCTLGGSDIKKVG